MTQKTVSKKINDWNSICFPIEIHNLSTIILPGYDIIPTDRRIAVIGDVDGEKKIFAIQSEQYALIPNSLIRNLVDESFSDYKLDIRMTKHGEFSINIIMPSMVTVGSETLFQSLIINNSYSGKTPFSLQGSVISEKKESKIKVSYYRQICSNGLMGWADEFYTHDEYLQWLLDGKPKIYDDYKKEKVEVVEVVSDRKEEKILSKSYSHKGLSLNFLAGRLKEIFEGFKKLDNSVTSELYKVMVMKKLSSENVEKMIVKVGLPKQLAKLAMERLEFETVSLKSDINAFLAYNAVNYALFNGKTSMTLSDRYKVDELAFEQANLLTL